MEERTETPNDDKAKKGGSLLSELTGLVMLKNLFKRGKSMDTFKRHIELLGYKAKDKVTGFSGTIDSVCFDLYGCVQISLRPQVDKDGKIPDGHWFDVTRLDIDTDDRVVEMPNFYEGYVAEGRKGPAEKPLRRA